MGNVVNALAFPVPPKDLSLHALRSRESELFFLKAAVGRIPAIFLRRPNAVFTIIYSHGNAEDVGLSLQYLDLLSVSCECNVFAYEYPGYSIAEGVPSESGVYQSINAAHEFLLREGILPEAIVIFGRSLGTGPSIDICSRYPRIAGCILQSPLESGIRCVMGTVPSYLLYGLDVFRSYEKIGRIKCPVLIMHGELDEIVPCRNGRALYAALQERATHEEVAYEPVWLPAAGHNNMPINECLEHCRRFLDYLYKRRTPNDLVAKQDNIGVKTKRLEKSEKIF